MPGTSFFFTRNVEGHLLHMRRLSLYLSLWALVTVLGVTLGTSFPGQAGDQPLVLAQRAAPAVPQVAAPAPQMEQRRPAACGPPAGAPGERAAGHNPGIASHPGLTPPAIPA